jgi:hypothetical protein
MPIAQKVKLTDAFVAKASLPEGKDDHIFWDTEVTGFGLRLRTNAKTYIIMYRPAGAGRSTTAKKFKLGSAEILGAAKARQEARAKLGEVASGKDPAGERSEERRRKRSRIVDLLDGYELWLEGRSYVDIKPTMSTLRRNLASFFTRDIKAIKASEIVDVRSRLTKAGKPGAAKNFFSRCRAFFSWCQDDQKVIESNPIYAHRKAKRTRSDKLEDEEEVGRALSDDELVKVWMAASPKHPYDDPSAFGDYVRFLILTGCRRTEGSKVRRTMRQAGQSGPLLVIPKQITKSGRDHNLPVTSEIEAILGRRGTENDLYFPSWKTGRPMQGWAKMLKKVVAESGVDFALHDLRKTFRTGLSILRVDTDVGAICLNHSRKGLEAIYNRDTSGTEMRDAFTLWSNHVAGLVRVENAKRFNRFRPKPKAEPQTPARARLLDLKRKEPQVEEYDEGPQ